MTLYALDGVSPSRPANDEFFVAPGAHVIGDVHIGESVSIWFGAVIRGDNEPVVLGPGTNIQDNAVLHNDPRFPLTIGVDCTIGHAAIVHGCTIGDRCLIGMGATILNGAVIEDNCLIGAKALVPEGARIPQGSLVLGVRACRSCPFARSDCGPRSGGASLSIQIQALQKRVGRGPFG